VSRAVTSLLVLSRLGSARLSLCSAQDLLDQIGMS
jgi:hypothetical protein